MKKISIFVGLFIVSSLVSSDSHNLNQQWKQQFKDLNSLVDRQKQAIDLVSSIGSHQSLLHCDMNHLRYVIFVRQQTIHRTISNLCMLTEEINSRLPQPKDTDVSSIPSEQTTAEDISSLSDISLPTPLRSRVNSISEVSDHDNHEKVSICAQDSFENQLARKFHKDKKKIIELSVEAYRKKQSLRKKQKQAQQSLYDRARHALHQELLHDQAFNMVLENKIKKDQQRYKSLTAQVIQEKENKAQLLKKEQIKAKEFQEIEDAIFLNKLDIQLQKNDIQEGQIPSFIIRHGMKHSQLIYPRSFEYYKKFNDYSAEIYQYVIQPISEMWTKALIDRDARLDKDQIDTMSKMFELVLTQALYLRYEDALDKLS